MKKILFTLLLLLSPFLLSSCTKNNSQDLSQNAITDQEKEQATKLIAKHLQSEYSINNPSISITQIIRRYCPACYLVIALFEYQDEDLDQVNRKEVQLEVEDGQIKGVSISKNSIIILTQDQCLKRGGEPLAVSGSEGCPEGRTYLAEVKSETESVICCQ